MKVRGLIERISKTSITIKVSPYWDYDESLKEWRPLRNPVTMTLQMEPALIDKAIASYANLLEFQIQEGKILKLKRVKPPAPPPVDIDLRPTLRDKMQIFLNALLELQREQTAVPKDELISKLGEKGMPPEEVNRLIELLKRDGTIYVPKDGYLKKT
jgi:hypothetical protein